ncbi:hypothetical protein AG4045_014383 [Apium graveolens]|uniref:Activator of Hsp90 ATPase AHSA1-like N-terminal domain-containing protein n=1 Tax=Apium graveolens TaxID=4045 RepID=A0A6L5BB26_APIGR|nr:hypothetical protein AG4045_014383 [Apium graveolens]
MFQSSGSGGQPVASGRGKKKTKGKEAGTWEEKDLNGWATHKIKELLGSTTLEFSGGRAEIVEVSKCSGDAFLVTVRNKKRVGYTYELTIIVKGEWVIGDEKKKVKGHLDVPEFTFGELDDLQVFHLCNRHIHTTQEKKNIMKGFGDKYE